MRALLPLPHVRLDALIFSVASVCSLVIASLLVTHTEQQDPETTEVAADDAPTTVQYEAWRVRLILGHPLQFTKGKLWPQGEKQTEYAQLSYEYSVRISQLAENAHLAKTPEYEQFSTEARKLKKEMDAKLPALKFLDAPIEAIVREIHELNGNVYIIGAAFGSMNYAPIEDIPKAACIVSRRITEQAFPEFIVNLRELAAIEASLIEEEDDEEEEEEEETDEETDDDEEPSTGDVVVEAATALVSSATSIEARPEGPMVLVPANVWEPLCQAVAAHISDGAEEEEGGAGAGEGEALAPPTSGVPA